MVKRKNFETAKICILVKEFDEMLYILIKEFDEMYINTTIYNINHG